MKKCKTFDCADKMTADRLIKNLTAYYNVDCLLRVLPQVVPLYSRQRLYVYAFYSRYSDLWNNWQPFKERPFNFYLKENKYD